MSTLVFQTNRDKLIVEIGIYKKPALNLLFEAVYQCGGVTFHEKWHAEHEEYNDIRREKEYDIARYAFLKCIDPEYSPSTSIVQRYLKHGIVIGRPLYEEWVIEGRRWNQFSQKEKDDFSTYRSHNVPYTQHEQEFLKEISAPIYEEWKNNLNQSMSINYKDRIINQRCSREGMNNNIEKEKTAAAKEGRLTVWDREKAKGSYCPVDCPEKLKRETELDDCYAERRLEEARAWRQKHAYLEQDPEPVMPEKTQKAQGDIETMIDKVFSFIWG